MRSTLIFIGKSRSLTSNVYHISRPRRFSSSSSTPEIYDVVCVGGGPAGLSLLAGLRASKVAKGLKIALIESQDLKRSNLKDTSQEKYSNRCSSLTPGSMNYLKDIGVWSKVELSRVQPYQEMKVWDGVNDSRITFDWHPFSLASSKSPTIAYMIENVNLTTGLLSQLTTCNPPIDKYSPTKVESISFGEDTPSLDLRSWPILTLSNGQILAARLLVGADGANSPVRAFAGIESRGWDYGRHGVVATLRLASSAASGNAHKIAYQRFLPSGPIAMLPLPGNIASLVWTTTPERAVRLKSLASEDFIAMVNAAFRLSMADIDYMHTVPTGQADELEWRLQHANVDEETVPDRVVSLQEGTIASFPLRMRHADTYTGERVALVGDAAHTIHPLAGQGLNQGQGDAAALVRTIEEALASGMDIGSTFALEGYNAARYSENNALIGVCDKLHKLYSWESGPVVWARGLGLTAVDAMGPLKALIMQKAAGG